MNVTQVLQSQAKKYAAKPALIFREQLISYAELAARVFQLANGLAGLGLKKGDKLAICLPNGPEYVYAYLAGFTLGATIVPLDFMLKTDEIVSCLKHSECRFFIIQPRPDIDVNEVKKEVTSLSYVIPAENLLELLENSSAEPIETSIAETDPSLIMYTSGTTGNPKGILLTYKHLSGSPEAMKHFVDLSDQDVKIAAIPFSHIGGFIYIQNCLLYGISLVIMDRFSPYEFLRLVQQHRVTCFHIVPAMYTALLSLKQIEKFDLSSLRWVVVFGAPSSPEIMERFHQYCPNAQLLNGWGMTETCPPNTVTPLGSKNIASIGKPSPLCKIKVVDEEGKEVPPGHVGEILISGWIVMQEYYKDREATAAMKKNGWLHTGDLGKFDAEGYLYIVGRKKEMIKVAGQIVYAPEVEAAFYKHEAVLEAAVIGIKDELRGETVKAFVALKEGQFTTPEELRYFLKQLLANFKVPSLIEIRASLPKNRTGKIDKELLKNDVIARVT